MNRLLTTMLMCLVLCFSVCAQKLDEKQKKLLDVPQDNKVSTQADSINYAQVLKQWKSAKDVNQWIGQNFHYDISRAIALGSKRENGPKPAIYSAEELYSNKNGICVDLSRFAYETIKKIEPEKETYYLMIDFEPIEIQGSVIRKHWVIAFKENGSFYVMADSKIPGVMSGPYASIESYIKEYEAFRERKIESFKLLNDYKRKQKQKLAKVKKADKGLKQETKGK